ncbi:MAG: ABC transporter substrate-binding protein [Chloroflexota bacterium]
MKNIAVHGLPRAVALFSISALVWTACSSPSASPTPASTKPQSAPTSAAAATAAPAAAAKSEPKPAAKPSVQRVVMSIAPATIESNDVRHVGQTSTWQIKPIYEYLLGVDSATGKLVPQLATEWKMEKDGLAIRFMLRKGVPFHHDSGEFTAKDVVFSWQNLTRPDSLHNESGWWRALVKEIEVVNDYEVVFNLSRVDSGFFRAIGESESGMEMRSLVHYEKAGEPTMQSQPIAGTGPYQYRSRVQGSNVIFDRVPYQHWRVTPDFPEFEFRFQKEASTRLAALQAGEVHIANLPEDLLVDAQKRGYQVVKGTQAALRAAGGFQCCFLNDIRDPSKGYKYPDSPLMDVRVRKALNKAINRDELNKAFFGGKGELMYVNHFHPTRPGWNPDWEKRFPDEYGYDPAKARALLAEAGKSDLRTNMHVFTLPQYSGADDIAESIAGYWEKIGVTVSRVQIEGDARQAGTREQRYDNHFWMYGTSSSLLTGIFTQSSSRGSRTAPVEDPVVDKLLDDVRATFDEDKQEVLFRQLGEEIFVRQINAPLFWLPAEVLVNTRVVGGWEFPGSITGNWTHLHNVKAAP